MNCRASSFILTEKHPNSLKPRKKPFHTLSALIVKEEDGILAMGLSGGHYRPQLHAQIFENIYKFGMNPQEALEHPRFVWNVGTNQIRIEEGYDAFRISGYRVERQKYPGEMGVAAAAKLYSNGIKAAFTDIRGDGLSLGQI